MNSSSETVGVLIFAFICCGVAAWITGKSLTYAWQQEAIQHRAAEWRVNPQTGETTFTWLTTQGTTP